MKKVSNIEDEITEKSESLLNDMENRIYDMWKQHETNFLTLIGFLIATSAIIITADNVDCSVRCLLILSIISFAIWLFLSNNVYWAQILKFKKAINSVLKISELTKAEDMISAQKEADDHLKINKKDIRFTTLATTFENIWFVLFVIWLFKFL